MPIRPEPLTRLILNTRDFLAKASDFLDKRNHGLQAFAVDDSLYMNYFIGSIVQANLMALDKELEEAQQTLGLASSPSTWLGRLTGYLKSYFQEPSRDWKKPSWQHDATVCTHAIQQGLMSAKEWLNMDVYNTEMACLAVPVAPHVKYRNLIRDVNECFKDLETCEAYQSLAQEVTPRSQEISYFSGAMLDGMMMLRLRVDGYLMENYRAKLPDSKKCPDQNELTAEQIQKIGQDDLKVVFNLLDHVPENDVSYISDCLTRYNGRSRDYLPLTMRKRVDSFYREYDEARYIARQLSVGEIKDIVDMSEMPRPDNFGLKKK